MTQRDMIRAYLEDGRMLTPLHALSMFGCLRLAARIGELRKEGMPIVTDMIDVGNKGTKVVACYYLPTDPQDTLGL